VERDHGQRRTFFEADVGEFHAKKRVAESGPRLLVCWSRRPGSRGWEVLIRGLARWSEEPSADGAISPEF
jgi:hypothetical protein